MITNSRNLFFVRKIQVSFYFKRKTIIQSLFFLEYMLFKTYAVKNELFLANIKLKWLFDQISNPNKIDKPLYFLRPLIENKKTKKYLLGLLQDFSNIIDLSENENHGVVNGANWSNETNNTQCVENLCEQIEITFLSINTDTTPNTIEFEIDVQYIDEYGFGYGGFVLANENGEIVAQENLETAGNVYWIGQGMNEARVLIANEELSFPFSGSLYLVEGFFAGNSNAECVYNFIPGCMNSNAINYNSEATIDDGSCQFDNACNVDAIEVEAFMYGYEPSNVIIEVGGQVTWTNIGGYHDVN